MPAMRAVLLQSTGPDSLALVEQPDPQPGPGEVLVRIRHASLNFRDGVVVAGGYGSALKPPLVPLSDGAGEVVAIGDGVQRWRVGDRVTTCFFRDWIAGEPTLAALATSHGGPLDGALRELAVFPERALAPVPAHMSLRQAATLPCAAVTAWTALAVLDRIGAEDTVLVQGTGGVSLFALQLAKAMGARVIATSSSDEKLERVRALGADHTLNYRTTPKWGATARELTGGRGVDHVIEVGGAGTVQQSLRATRPGGTVSLIGVLAGARNEIHLPHIFLSQIRMQGIVVGSHEAAENLARALEAHAIEPVIDDAEFGLEQLPEALAYLHSGKHFGKVTLAIGD
jgi:NADPH:quinone reductase-like Zn-dependent oxidoreductase